MFCPPISQQKVMQKRIAGNHRGAFGSTASTAATPPSDLTTPFMSARRCVT